MEVFMGEKVKRIGQIIRLNLEKLEEYKRLHSNAWEGVLKTIYDCNIRNFSIFYRDGYLFSYYEYIGDDYEKDMEKMAADEITQEWWKQTSPCQKPIETAGKNEWWVMMEEVFHC
jgi:L-rhamnose mutarotase